MDAVGRSEVGEKLGAGGETDGGGAEGICLIEYGDRHGVADQNEVAEVDEGVDGRDVAVLGKSSEQCFGGDAVLGRFGAESGEDPSPGGDRGYLGYRVRLQPLCGGSLFGPVLVEQFRCAGTWLTRSRG